MLDSNPVVSSSRRILVVPLRFIGDTILTVPLLRQIKARWPEDTVHVLTSPTAAPLLTVSPYVDAVVEEPKKLQDRLRLIREGQYDVALLLRKSVSMAALLKWANIPYVVGYDKQRWFNPLGYKRTGWFLDAKAPYPSLRTVTPQALSHLSLLALLDHSYQPKLSDASLELWTTPEDVARVDTLLSPQLIEAGRRPWAAFHGASASHGKTVAAQKFIPALQRLHQGGYGIVSAGTEADAPWLDALAQEAQVPLLNLAGKTTLRETLALYQKCQVMVSVDSAPLHMAVAMEVPHVIGVFGPTNEQQWGYGHQSVIQFQAVFNPLPCRPCYAKVCDHNRCKTELSPEAITRAVDRAMAGAVPALSSP